MCTPEEIRQWIQLPRCETIEEQCFRLSAGTNEKQQVLKCANVMDLLSKIASSIYFDETDPHDHDSIVKGHSLVWETNLADRTQLHAERK